MNLMVPVEKTYNPDQIDGKLSAFSKPSRGIQISLTAPVGKYGMATVDGIPLSRCEQVSAVGFSLVLDNFEWQASYAKTFGLIAVDWKTQVCSPKVGLRVLGEFVKGWC